MASDARDERPGNDQSPGVRRPGSLYGKRGDRYRPSWSASPGRARSMRSQAARTASLTLGEHAAAPRGLDLLDHQRAVRLAVQAVRASLDGNGPPPVLEDV